MCFSANVSFIASGLLFLLGGLSLKTIKTKFQIPFALIPVFFAIQQLAEGFLWLELQGHKIGLFKEVYYLVYIFLFFALIIWPTWIPFSILCLEKKKSIKFLLAICLLIGLFISVYCGYYIFVNGVSAKILLKHIYYEYEIPEIFKYSSFAYLAAVVLPFFLSSVRFVWLFGIVGLLSLLISFIIYTYTLTSVWCFFAAILSLMIYWVIKKS